VAAGPGYWNDLDFLMVGYKELKKWQPRQSAAEYRSQFSLFAVLAAPLMFSADIRGTMGYNRPTVDGTNRTTDIRSIIGNAEVIAVSQDPLGRQGRLVKELQPSGVQLYVRVLEGGALALAVLNRRSGAVSKLAVHWVDDVGVPVSKRVAAVRDLWARSTLPLAAGAAGVVIDVASHETRLLRLQIEASTEIQQQ
jgi:alpha-galactosidase